MSRRRERASEREAQVSGAERSRTTKRADKAWEPRGEARATRRAWEPRGEAKRSEQMESLILAQDKRWRRA